MTNDNGFHILPYYHPTTAILIDDQVRYVDELAFALNCDVFCRTFQRPDDALAYINTPQQRTPLHRRWLAARQSPSDGRPTPPALQFAAQALLDEFKDDSRFQTITTVVADYNMPQMNGLECLDRIADRRIHRILLTGVATIETGFAALNAGRIHHYIAKGSPNEHQLMSRKLMDYEQQFLNEQLTDFQRALPEATIAHLRDAGFAAQFDAWRAQAGIVEHYFVNDPKGFLCFAADGAMTFLAVQTPTDRQLRIKQLRDHEAPASLLAVLAADDDTLPVLPWAVIPTLTDTTWQAYLHLSQTWSGDAGADYAVAVIDGGALLGLGSSSPMSLNDYDAFLQHLYTSRSY